MILAALVRSHETKLDERCHFLCVAFERENVATLMQHRAHRVNFLQLSVTKPNVSHLKNELRVGCNTFVELSFPLF